VRGPGFTNVDLSVFRNFPIGGHRLEARFEVFNLFNSPRWNNPPNNSGNLVGHPRFMQVVSSVQAYDRQIRLGLRYSF
jgi:outer membrane receptor protein involved in Fe transport